MDESAQRDPLEAKRTCHRDSSGWRGGPKWRSTAKPYSSGGSVPPEKRLRTCPAPCRRHSRTSAGEGGFTEGDGVPRRTLLGCHDPSPSPWPAAGGRTAGLDVGHAQTASCSPRASEQGRPPAARSIQMGRSGLGPWCELPSPARVGLDHGRDVARYRGQVVHLGALVAQGHLR